MEFTEQGCQEMASKESKQVESSFKPVKVFAGVISCHEVDNVVEMCLRIFSVAGADAKPTHDSLIKACEHQASIKMALTMICNDGATTCDCHERRFWMCHGEQKMEISTQKSEFIDL